MKHSTLLLLLLVLLACTSVKSQPLFKHFQPIPENSGFRMEGYWVWGGSVIKVGSVYHLFASRWPQKNKFPDDYFKESEIVRATSHSAMGPYTFQEVVIGERDSCYWDSNMAHNPTIHRIGNKYVLFYIGSDFSTLRKGSDRLLRRIGYATATNINGPWTRCKQPLINEESNNPAIFVEPDNKVKLLFRDENLKIKIADAPGFEGPFTLKNNDVWPAARLEDFYLFRKDGKYHFICEDNEGKATGHIRWGAHFISDDGINNWQPDTSVIAYSHSIVKANGDTLHCVRRERPQLFIQNNQITHLFNGVYNGTQSWCQPVELKPALNLQR